MIEKFLKLIQNFENTFKRVVLAKSAFFSVITAKQMRDTTFFLSWRWRHRRLLAIKFFKFFAMIVTSFQPRLTTAIFAFSQNFCFYGILLYDTQNSFYGISKMKKTGIFGEKTGILKITFVNCLKKCFFFENLNFATPCKNSSFIIWKKWLNSAWSWFLYGNARFANSGSRHPRSGWNWHWWWEDDVYNEWKMYSPAYRCLCFVKILCTLCR